MFDGAGNNATITAIWKHCLLGLNALGACVQFPMHLHRPTLIQVNVAFTINVMHFHYWEHPITFVAGLCTAAEWCGAAVLPLQVVLQFRWAQVHVPVIGFGR